MNSIAREQFNRPLALVILVTLAFLVVMTLTINPAPLQAAFAADQASFCIAGR